ncbi:MAG: sialate O-acetylesterase [Oscillospiraceae bacterium]|nr:sialate O-acetylesterase [Oscillospiraceae bacterium]
MSGTTRLSGIFGNGTVLQRNEWNTITGTDTRANSVTAEIDGETYAANTEDGRFSIRIPPRDAAVDLTVIVTGTDRIILKEVCFGDVFMLSGQSNMELPMARVADLSQDDIDSADNPLIRQFRLTPRYVFGEESEAILQNASWTRAIPGEILEMSAAGYFFAQKIFEKINVPIGLVLNAQGGASIEAWMPMSVLNGFGNYRAPIEPFLRDGSLDEFLAERQRRVDSWYAELETEETEDRSREIPEDAIPVTLPGLFPAGTEKFCGSVWFYREFILEKNPGDPAFLYLGELVDSDTTYINGVPVGQTGYRYPPRKYDFDASVLKKGRNRIAVRLVIEYGKGGFIPEHPYYIESGIERIELSGQWFYRIENEARVPGVEGFLAQKLPTGLFRAAILPLRGFSMKGVLWYQGESNAGDPERYDDKFAAMIEAWRNALDTGLPVICVELADYIDPINGLDKGWAAIQELQRAAPEKTSRCAVVSAKDLGAPFELHPQNKKDLGERLARKAYDLFYGLPG